MRQLHVVALSEDGRFLLLAPTRDAAKGTFKVPLDARLNAALRGELPRPGQTAPPASDLTPKQIQARLRAGESVEQIARSAGVPAARVERFAGPVEGERARIIEAAQASVLTRARRGASAVSLGEAVAAHLAEVEVDPAEVQWAARREDDGAWMVEAGYTSRGRKKRSTWRYDPGSGDLTAADASSAVLGYVEPADGRPATRTVAAVKSPPRRRTPATSAARRSAAAPRVPAAAKAPAKAAVKKAAVEKAAVKKAAVKKAAVKQAGAKAPVKKAAVKKAAVKKAAASKAKPAPAKAPAPRTSAARPAADKTVVQARADRARAAAPAGPPQLRVVPPPDDEPRARASVPTWADVLLSTTPPSRPTTPDDQHD